MWTPLTVATSKPSTFQGINRHTSAATATDATSKEEQPSEIRQEFADFMQQVLGASSTDQVSEEELFAGVMQQRIKELKGDEALKKFQEIFDAEKTARTKPDGFIPYEDAARAALKKFTDAGELSAEEADTIHTYSFNAAQLDGNKDTLFDDRGGANDPTIAVASMQTALIAMQARLDGFTAGSEIPTSRPLDADYPSGKPVSTNNSSSSENSAASTGSLGGFLFKPVSDTTGKLVVLLPNELTGDITGVILRDKDGKEIERGSSGGIGNGDREHYRFSRSGGEYPDNLTVEVQLRDGTTRSFDIADPSQRYE